MEIKIEIDDESKEFLSEYSKTPVEILERLALDEDDLVSELAVKTLIKQNK
ncbi:MAG: hypothetical protein LBT99_03715 [Bifidobacteriaceae bacterium]|jgi:hypothetical protein|nr:hypothetical protein [Bifidobacteriaceae bacterium]